MSQNGVMIHSDGTAVEVTAPSTTTSPVDHPPHYNQLPNGIECIDVVEHFNFNLGNAMKYIWRSGYKGKQLEDLNKAVWYLEREIARLESEQ